MATVREWRADMEAGSTDTLQARVDALNTLCGWHLFKKEFNGVDAIAQLAQQELDNRNKGYKLWNRGGADNDRNTE